MKKLILAVCIASIGSGAYAQQCGDPRPSDYAPSWGSTSIQSVESMSHPNGAFHGYSYFFWHNAERTRFFQSRGTSFMDQFSRIVPFGGHPTPDATFELRTDFKNNLPGVFYSNDPAGPWQTNLDLPFIRHDGSGNNARQVSVGTFQAATIEVGKVYWFHYPMVGSTTLWYLPARSAIQIDAVVGKRWPANFSYDDVQNIGLCAETTVLPQGWVTAPVECAKWSYDYGLNPPIPTGVLGGPMAHNPDLVEKRMPGLSRFGNNRRPQPKPPTGVLFIDIFQSPGQMTSGASFAYC